MLNDDYGQRAQLAQTYRNGANWFYWIAVLSLVTSLIGLAGINWRFLISLGVTQVIDSIAIALTQELGGATMVIAVVLDIFIVAACAGVGWLAGHRHFWAYIVGMVLFLLDGVLSLIFTDWLGVLVHGWALFSMFRGFQAGRELVALERSLAEQPPVATAEAPAPAATV